ncbi:MAG: HlyD family secretion protein [Myxococcota bacterium]|jgi:HlyD family secretion protein
MGGHHADQPVPRLTAAGGIGYAMQMKRVWIIGVVVVVVGAAGFALRGAVRTTQGPRVESFVAVRQPLAQTLLLTGRFAQPTLTDLGSMAQSTVVEVPVDEGDEVAAGTLLVRLADDEAAAQLREAEAQVAEAAARLGKVRGVGRQLADERLAQARLDAGQAEREFARQQKLFTAEALDEAAFDAVRQRRDSALSQRVSAELEAAATGRGGADSQAAAASLARAQASLEGAQATLSRARIRAPSDGVVLQRLVEPGQVVRPGDPLIRFSQAGPLEVRITPDEVHLGRLAVGQSAKVGAEAFPETVLDATVVHIAPRVDPSRGTVEVRLALAALPDGLALRPDMTATVEVLLGETEDALVLPTSLVRDRGGTRPWVLVAHDGTAERRDVRLGLEGTDAVEVLSGLDADDVVLPPQADVAVGEPVRVRPPAPSLPPPGG